MPSTHNKTAKPSERRQPNKAGPSESEYSSDYDEDRGRIVFSSALRRLAGVTQVTPATESLLLHNRLTHSLKVAEVGKRLVDQLLTHTDSKGLDLKTQADLDPAIVEAAGLAHDLGHPPFGHAAEAVLDELARNDGLEGFEGNAQTFRIVTKIELRGLGAGLNLTRASLNAILKYPCLKRDSLSRKDVSGKGWFSKEYGRKWGAYESEEKILDWVRLNSESGKRSAAAMLTDWADDIAYAIHDMEDYFRTGVIPLHRIEDDGTSIISHAVDRLTGDDFKAIDFQTAFNTVLKSLPFRHPFKDTTEDRQRLHSYSEARVRDFVCAVRPLSYSPYVFIDRAQQYEVEVLKELTWYYVIHNPALAMVREGHEKVIRELYATFSRWLTKEKYAPNVPRALQRIYAAISDDREAGEKILRNPKAKISRAVCDYICTLTDEQAIATYERVMGLSRNSLFGSWQDYA